MATIEHEAVYVQQLPTDRDGIILIRYIPTAHCTASKSDKRGRDASDRRG